MGNNSNIHLKRVTTEFRKLWVIRDYVCPKLLIS